MGAATPLFPCSAACQLRAAERLTFDPTPLITHAPRPS
jgi:hypothetical protein